MNHIADTIAALEQELDAIDQRRGDIARAIETLRPLAGEPAPAEFKFKGKARRISARAAKASGRKKRIEKRQTDRQTEQGAGRRAARSLPNDDNQKAIVEQIRSFGGVAKPGELARKLNIQTVTLRAWIKPLIKSKAVIATGTTMSRRFSLPGRGPKEAL
jgi:hypothetical protein